MAKLGLPLTDDLIFAGRPGTHLHGDLHHRNVHQNPGFRIHFTQEQLHAESMEHYGLCGRRFWVRNLSHPARLSLSHDCEMEDFLRPEFLFCFEVRNVFPEKKKVQNTCRYLYYH